MEHRENSEQAYEQLRLDGIESSEPVQGSLKNPVPEEYFSVINRFLPTIKVEYDFENDEIVLR